MQVLDQKVAPARCVAEERLHFVERLSVHLPALRRAARAAPAGARMDVAHESRSFARHCVLEISAIAPAVPPSSTLRQPQVPAMSEGCPGASPRVLRRCPGGSDGACPAG